MLLVVGQLLALAHEAEERHVECADHGEQLEAAKLVDSHDSESSRWVAVEGDGGEHEDCALARSLRQASSPHTQHIAVVVTATIATVDTPPLAVESRTAELYLIAPKTSPPARS